MHLYIHAWIFAFFGSDLLFPFSHSHPHPVFQREVESMLDARDELQVLSNTEKIPILLTFS